MLWRVSLVACCDGSEPEGRYAQGVVIEDRREGAADLIRAANAQWGTEPQTGEVYRVEVVEYPRYYRVKNQQGHLEPWSE